MSPFSMRSPFAQPRNLDGRGPLFACLLDNATRPCYDPYLLRRAYEIEPLIREGYDGSGQTIVIVDAFQSPNIKSQLTVFCETFGLPCLNGLGKPYQENLGTFTQIAPFGLTPFNSSDSDHIGWAEEISLDVQWAHAIAPGANIVLALGLSPGFLELLSVLEYVIDNEIGDIISQSFGIGEDCDPVTDLVHEALKRAVEKRITVLAANSDDGSASFSCVTGDLLLLASSPANQPLLLSVGGTSLTATLYPSNYYSKQRRKPPGTYKSEVVWNEDLRGNIIGGGGGFSNIFSRPQYQAHHVTEMSRGLPDISLNAGVSGGVLTYLDIPGDDQGFFSFGGTSASTPEWAGIIAIANQKAGYNLGFINPALYFLAETKDYNSAFHDIVVGNNSCTVEGYFAIPGWDAASGLGTAKAQCLVDKLIAASHSPYLADVEEIIAQADADMEAWRELNGLNDSSASAVSGISSTLADPRGREELGVGFAQRPL